MNCQEITNIITDIPGLKKTLDLAIKKEMSIKDGLGAKKNIETNILEAEEATRMRFAEKLFDQDFLGPKAIEAVFGPDSVPTKIPAIPFSREELKNAEKLGQFLILRTNQISEDKLYLPNTKRTIANAPETRWALVTKDLIPNSTNKNYLEQTEEIIKYLQEQVFAGREIPREYQKAIDEFEAQKEELRSLAESPDETIWLPAAERLANLQINQLTRRNTDEALYDLEMYEQTNNEYLLPKSIMGSFPPGRLDWTNSMHIPVPSTDAVGNLYSFETSGLVWVGSSVSQGVEVSWHRPKHLSFALGVVFSYTH